MNRYSHKQYTDERVDPCQSIRIEVVGELKRFSNAALQTGGGETSSICFEAAAVRDASQILVGVTGSRARKQRKKSRWNSIYPSFRLSDV